MRSASAPVRSSSACQKSGISAKGIAAWCFTSFAGRGRARLRCPFSRAGFAPFGRCSRATDQSSRRSMLCRNRRADPGFDNQIGSRTARTSFVPISAIGRPVSAAACCSRLLRHCCLCLAFRHWLSCWSRNRLTPAQRSGGFVRFSVFCRVGSPSALGVPLAGPPLPAPSTAPPQRESGLLAR